MEGNNERARSMSGRGMSNSRYRITFVGMLLLLFAVFLAALTIGRYDITIIDSIKILLSRVVDIEATWSGTMETVIFKLRLPRTLAAILIGAALAVSGAAYQSMFKNPMVSPDLLGVSSGAAIGASLAILWGLSAIYIQLWAFIGGIIAVTITAMIPRLMRNDSIIMLVLAGVIVGGLMSSIMGIIKFVADADTALAQMTYWAMGSVAKVTMPDLYTVGPAIFVAGIMLLSIRYRLNVMSLGESEAKTLGVNVGRTRVLIIVTATLLTASAVCIAGTVGWVGLVIPHLGRMLVGSDNRKMLPVAAIMGAIFMIMIDTTARSLTNAELPISIITGIIGAPFYFYLLIKQRMALK